MAKKKTKQQTTYFDQAQAESKETEISPQPVKEITLSAPEKKALKKAAINKEALIYIGPNLPGGKLFQFTVFKAGVLPKHTQDLKESCPALKFLFIKVSSLSKAKMNLGDKNSVESAKFLETVKHFDRGAN